MERRGDLRGDHRGAPRRRQPLHLPRGAAHGQRPTGHPPRHLEAVQGHGMPMEDHGGARRRAQGGLGHPRPARRDRGAEETRSDVQRGHRGLWHGGIQREVQGERLDLRGGVARDDRTHGLLDRHGRPLRYAARRVYRIRMVVTQADVRKGAAVPRTQGPALLPPDGD